jgi:tRNA threonylcarbamoyladenosine biosynthesis protein TsaB
MILAIDTSMSAASACTLASGTDEPAALQTTAMERGHAEALMPLIEAVINKTPGGFEALTRIAVAVGPGSFTGIRVGVSAARAIALARELPVVGVSTLAAFAAPWLAADNEQIVAAAIDARHGNIYVQAFAPGGRSILTPRLMTPREAVRAIGSGPICLTGSGAPLLAAEALIVGIEAKICGELHAPDILQVARLGFVADPATAPARPFYLKAPDAKPIAVRAIQRASS